MELTVYPYKGGAVISAPPSKSETHRYILMSALADGTTVIENAAACADITATLSFARAIGASAEVSGGTLTVKGRGGAPNGKIIYDALESGTTLRMTLPLIAAMGEGGAITMRGSLIGRPLGGLADELSRRGAPVTINGAAVSVTGKAEAGMYTVPADISSQYISGMLLAMAERGDMTLRTAGRRVSTPYIEMTKAALEVFGVTVRDDGEVMSVSGHPVSPGRVKCGGDWSAASVWLATGHTVTGLDTRTCQGDSRVMGIARSFGAQVIETAQGIRFDTRDMRAARVDITDTPDLAPAVMLLAAQAAGETVITGAHRLRAKESDRAVTLTAALGAIGGQAFEDGDILRVRGGELSGGVADACGDHRVAMMCAAAATLARGAVTIKGAECTEKSWGTFAQDIIRAGIRAEESI